MKTVINFIKAIWVYIVFSIKGKSAEAFTPLAEEVRLSKVQTDVAIQSILDKKFSHLGSSVHKGNTKMWAFNLEADKIEEVPILQSASGEHRGFMNPNYPHVWAINEKNAKRKFKKMGYE